MEQEAFNEAMANIGSGLGTSISFTQNAGQQVAMDVTRGLMQGASGYLAKKFRTVKVKLKIQQQTTKNFQSNEEVFCNVRPPVGRVCGKRTNQ